MLTLKDMVNDISAIDEMQLAKISDKLWEFGTLEEIYVAECNGWKVLVNYIMRCLQ